MNNNIEKNNKLFYDKCYLDQKQKDNFSIFNYYTDQSMYINNDDSDLYKRTITGTPPQILINIENDLRNITRENSKCIYKKYIPKKYI